jgi:hypothetical protein
LHTQHSQRTAWEALRFREGNRTKPGLLALANKKPRSIPIQSTVAKKCRITITPSYRRLTGTVRQRVESVWPPGVVRGPGLLKRYWRDLSCDQGLDRGPEEPHPPTPHPTARIWPWTPSGAIHF